MTVSPESLATTKRACTPISIRLARRYPPSATRRALKLADFLLADVKMERDRLTRDLAQAELDLGVEVEMRRVVAKERDEASRLFRESYLESEKKIDAFIAERDEVRQALTIMTRDRDACIALFKPSQHTAQMATDRNIELSRELTDAIARAEKAETERDTAAHLKDEALAELQRLCDPTLKDMRLENGKLDLSLSGPAVERIAAVVAEHFRALPAQNYIELSLREREPPNDRFVVSVQRMQGKSPHELRRKAEAERDEAKAELARDDVRRALADLLERVDINGGLGEYNGGVPFAVANARKALGM